MLTCSTENCQNRSMCTMPWEMHGAFLPFLSQITIVTNISVLSIILALYYFHVQASKKYDVLRRVHEKTSTCTV